MNKIEEVDNRKVKCVVWDLDNTLWDGVLVENTDGNIKENVREIIKELDGRGILQSISSKNDHELTMRKLKESGIDEYFIYPQINWGPKSESIEKIAGLINIGIDTIAFIDDQDFELEEVRYSQEKVLCINESELDSLLERGDMKPKYLTEDTKKRRLLYLRDIERNKEEESFNGTKEEFLRSLKMKLKITEAVEEDLMRVEELTVRTHQLNTSGYTYSYDELRTFINSKNYKLFVMELNDNFGEYGKVGLVLLECNEDFWTINLFIMSCRVMSRGLGSVVLNYIMNLAKESKVKLRAKFIPTDRNRIMYITYKFSGFYEVENKDDLIVLENDLKDISRSLDYIEIVS